MWNPGIVPLLLNDALVCGAVEITGKLVMYGERELGVGRTKEGTNVLGEKLKLEYMAAEAAVDCVC